MTRPLAALLFALVALPAGAAPVLADATLTPPAECSDPNQPPGPGGMGCIQATAPAPSPIADAVGTSQPLGVTVTYSASPPAAATEQGALTVSVPPGGSGSGPATAPSPGSTVPATSAGPAAFGGAGVTASPDGAAATMCGVAADLGGSSSASCGEAQASGVLSLADGPAALAVTPSGGWVFLCGVGGAAGPATSVDVACSDFQPGTLSAVCTQDPCLFGGLGSTAGSFTAQGLAVSTCGAGAAGQAGSPGALQIACGGVVGEPPLAASNASSGPGAAPPSAALTTALASTGLPLAAALVGLLALVAGRLLARRRAT